jgi:hypothetical protein
MNKTILKKIPPQLTLHLKIIALFIQILFIFIYLKTDVQPFVYVRF